MSPSLLVIGAGYLGAETARQALTSGFAPVIITRRNPEVLPGAQSLRLDVHDPATLESLPHTDVLVYAISAQGSSPEAYKKAYHDGLLNVLKSTSRWPKKPHILYVSSTSVYREETGAWITEETHDLASAGPSTAMVLGEKCLRESGFPYTILRFGGIYGPGRLSIVNRVKSGVEMLYSGDPLYSNRIHVSDGARIILHAAKTKACENRVFNVVDEAPANRNDVVRWLHQRLGLSSPLSSTADRSLLSVRGNKRCSSRALKETGYTFAFPTYREGYDAIISALHLG